MPVGAPELLIVLAIVILIFGVGRISKIGRELGEGVKGFRQGVKDATSDVEDDIKEKA